MNWNELHSGYFEEDASLLAKLCVAVACGPGLDVPSQFCPKHGISYAVVDRYQKEPQRNGSFGLLFC